MNRSGLGLSLVSAPETFNNNNYKYNICDAGRTLGDVIYQPGQAQACYSMQKAWFIYNTIHYTYLSMCFTESSCFSDIYNDFSQYLTCKSGLTFSVSASRLLSFIKALQKFGMMAGSDIVFMSYIWTIMSRRQLTSYFRGQITPSGQSCIKTGGGYASFEKLVFSST